MAKLKMGMIGGDLNSFIGGKHRSAAQLDGQIELVCGAFSASKEASHETGRALHLQPHRVYDTYSEMIQKEKELPEDQRMDFVSVVTPNHVHFDPCMMALDNGFHVVCEKPLAFNLQEALQLAEKVKSSGKLFAVTHTYTGYAMVKEAKNIVASGQLGTIRKIVVRYAQGWLSAADISNNPAAQWRTDPKRSGISCCMGDIGTHAANLAEYISGSKITKICSDLNSIVENRLLDDDASAFLRFDNGAKGLLFASQISAGEENELQINIYGEKGSIEWLQSFPQQLKVKWQGKITEIMSEGADKPYLQTPLTANAIRLPAGHPSGYLEAFANIYNSFAHVLNAHKIGNPITGGYDYPTVEDGVRGMRLIEAAVESSQKGQVWIDL